MRRALPLAAVLLLSCGGLGGPGLKSSGGGGGAVTEPLSLTQLLTAAAGVTLSGTTTNTLISATSAVNATSSVAAFTLKPSATLGANDLILNVEDAAGTNLFTVDLEGDTFASTLTVTGNIIPTNFVSQLGASGAHFDSIWSQYLYNNGVARFEFVNATGNVYVGKQVDGSGATAHEFQTGANYTTAGAKIAKFDNNTTEKAAVDRNGFFLNTVQNTVVADDAAGTKPASTFTPASEYATYACNDATGVTVTLSETGAQAGSKVFIVMTGTGNCEFADTSGVSELAGGFVAGASDTLTLIYANSAWHELMRSNN